MLYMRFCHIYSLPPRCLMWWSPQNNTQSLTLKKPADRELTVDYDGLCNTHGGSSVGAAGVQEKAWAGGWNCQQG